MKNRKLWVSIIAGILAAVMVLTIILSVLPVNASARSSSEIQEQIDQLEAQQAEMQAKMDELLEQMDQNESDTMDIVVQKSNIDQQISLLYSKIANINEQIDAYNVLIADKQDELTAAQKTLEELTLKNKDRIRAMEENSGLSYWSVLFKANSFTDFLDRVNMIAEINAADIRRIREMSEAAELVANAQDVLAIEKAGLEETKDELSAAQADMEAKRAESDVLLAELVAEAIRLDNDFFSYEQKTEELLAELGAAQTEYDNAKYQEWLATSVPTDPPDYGGSDYTPPSYSGDWIIPCDYVYFSGAFGWREPPVEGASSYHSGVDLAGGEGSPIWATRGGVVYRAGYNEYNGYYVGIDHGDGFASVYLHLTHYDVSIGDYVSQGEVLGYMGSTGISSGPHLHFTIYYNGNAVNPAEYIDFY